MIGWQVFAKESSFAKKPVNAGNIVCPVMGTKVVPGKSITVEYNGKLYNVCCPVCVKEFKKDPEKYDRIVEEQVKRAQSEEAK
jgi:YHS domain-containing protein